MYQTLGMHQLQRIQIDGIGSMDHACPVTSTPTLWSSFNFQASAPTAPLRACPALTGSSAIARLKGQPPSTPELPASTTSTACTPDRQLLHLPSPLLLTRTPVYQLPGTATHLLYCHTWQRPQLRRDFRPR